MFPRRLKGKQGGGQSLPRGYGWQRAGLEGEAEGESRAIYQIRSHTTQENKSL